MAQELPDELPRSRWWLKPLLVLALLAVLGFAGAYAYRRWEPGRLAAQGRTFLEKGDYRNAVLSAQRALQINPLNAEAARLMSQIAERLGSPAALAWRQQVVATDPSSTPDALALVTSALQLGRTQAATEALAQVPESARNTSRYHAQAGIAALQSRDARAAEKHFTEAVKIEPANELHQYNLATLQIQSSDPAQRALGAATLARLASGGHLQTYALRGVISQFVHEEKFPEALERSTQLVQTPAVDFRDRLTYLSLLQKTKAQTFPEALAETQHIALAQPDHVAQLLQWMRLSGQSTEALAWAAGLDAKTLGAGDVAMARAECLAETHDWEALKALTGEGNWGAREYLRAAWEARARRELRDNSLASSTWHTALTGALRNRDSVQQLFALAARWGWTNEARETLWAAADGAAPQWALGLLHRSYLSEGNTDGLLRVATRTLKSDPQSDPARNNLAMLSLLRNTDVDQAFESARALHAKVPDNPGYASTFALALHLRGKSAEGLEVLRKLTDEQRKAPAIAAYYGLLLAANGQAAEAEPYLASGRRSPLLPEEKALLAAAVTAPK